MRRIAWVTAVALGALLLGGCSEPEPPVTTAGAPSPSPSSSPSRLPGDGPVLDTASTCAAVSMIETTMQNAIADRSAHRISKAQAAAILATVTPAYVDVSIGLARSDDATLKAAVAGVIAQLPAEPKPTKPGFDPSSAAFANAEQRVIDLCFRNDTPVSPFRTTGG